MSSDAFSDSDYGEKKKPRKRIKQTNRTRNEDLAIARGASTFSLDPLLSVLRQEFGSENDTFEDVITPLLPDFLQVRAALLDRSAELDESGKRIRPLSHSEIMTFLHDLDGRESLSASEAIVARKLKLARERNRARIPERFFAALAQTADLTPLSPPPPPPVNHEVLHALYDIKTTPFRCSFLSRLHGTRDLFPDGLVAVDWETRTPWMNLMADIRDHYTFSHPDREAPLEHIAPITYSTMDAYQLPQINDLLERSFWKGIDASDSLDYSPEKSTVIAMYKKVVVGVAILSSPQETYITYLAVKAGWDKAQIARTMLYHLITMNPHKDITLHVSVNSSAMLLYNQFGFKAEEFVAGFYSEYLNPQSRASKNAFRLRLRMQ
ncbi:hypothetical protein B0H34DRAFT_843548 [Crassisporium funariophilum]|nr:hypothetical protein B0H34DRAFT_843548 [Crassisporium funariophilum]